jgi:hypothetical protein
MNPTNEDLIIESLAAKVAALEQALASQLPPQRAAAPSAPNHTSQTPAPPAGRRGFLRRALRTAAALVGAGVLVEASSGTALASGPGNFTSSNSTVPAVKATGTKGAKGVVASSDTSIALSGTSSSGNGLYAQSKSGIGAHMIGGGTTPSTPSFTEAAIFAEGGPGYGLYTTGSGSGDTLYAANTGTGNALYAQSSSGLAGHFTGNVQMDNNLTVTGVANTGTLSSNLIHGLRRGYEQHEVIRGKREVPVR